MSNKIYKPFLEKLGGTSAADYVGNAGEMFYDPETSTLRISDGTSAGGTAIGGNANTGDITFSGDVIGHVDGPEVGIRLRPNDPSIKLFLDTNRSWFFSSGNGNFDSGTWQEGEGVALTFINIDLELSDLLLGNALQNRKSITVTLRSEGTEVGGPITVTGFSGNAPGGNAYMYVQESPGAQPVYFDEIQINTVFENRIILDDDNGDWGFWLDNNNFRVDTQSDINLYAGDDIRIQAADLFRLINTSADEPIQIITDNNGTSRTWTFGADGNFGLPGALFFDDGSQQSSASISIVNLKTLVAESTDFADFQSRIAAL